MFKNDRSAMKAPCTTSRAFLRLVYVNRRRADSENEAAMIKIKHFLDSVEKDDGQRIWVEPIGLTKDLKEMCSIDHLLSHLGPNIKLWSWFEEHPEGYDYF